MSTVILCGKPADPRLRFQDYVLGTFKLVQEIAQIQDPSATTIKTLPDFYSKIVVAPYLNCIKFAAHWVIDSKKPACINMSLKAKACPGFTIEQCRTCAQEEEWYPAFVEEEVSGGVLCFIPEAEDFKNLPGIMYNAKKLLASGVLEVGIPLEAVAQIVQNVQRATEEAIMEQLEEELVR